MEEIMDDEILTILLNAEDKINCDYEKTFSTIVKHIDHVAIGFAKKQSAMNERIKERKQNKKRMPSWKLKKYIDNIYDGKKVGCGNTYTKKHAEYYITKILNFLTSAEIKKELSNEENILFYSFALREAFHSLLKCSPKNIPEKIVLKLYETFRIINDEIYLFETEFIKQEQEGDRNSRNASTRTRIKLTDCRKHARYPELIKYIESCEDVPTQTEIAKTNRILGDILGIKTKSTLRKYRHIFFREVKG